MKLYDFEMAPNPRRVRIFMAEKGIEIPTEQVDLASRAQMEDDYKKINPRSEVPVLELDDGTFLTESSAICLYFEGLHPEPNLMGTDALERAQSFMWDRRIELHGMAAIADAYRNTSPLFEDRGFTGPINFPQIPELAERGRARTDLYFDTLNERLSDSPYVAGDRFTIADITAMVSVMFARWIKTGPTDSHSGTNRWWEEVSARPSAGA